MKNKSALFLAILCVCSILLSSCAKNTVSEITSSSSKVESSSSEVSSSSAKSSSSSLPNPESDPDYVKAYQEYASGKYGSAVSLCNIVLKQDPNRFWAYNIKGISTYFMYGNKTAPTCIDLINKSLKINPDYSYAYFNRALIEKGTKKYDKSIEDFQKVLSYNKNDTWSYYGIATVYADTDDADNAIKYLKLALAIDEKGVKSQMYDDMSRHYSKLKNDSRFQDLLK